MLALLSEVMTIAQIFAEENMYNRPSARRAPKELPCALGHAFHFRELGVEVDARAVNFALGLLFQRPDVVARDAESLPR